MVIPPNVPFHLNVQKCKKESKKRLAEMMNSRNNNVYIGIASSFPFRLGKWGSNKIIKVYLTTEQSLTENV